MSAHVQQVTLVVGFFFIWGLGILAVMDRNIQAQAPEAHLLCNLLQGHLSEGLLKPTEEK